MSMNYDTEIKQMEAKYTLESQQNALTRVELECLRLKKKLEDYDQTRQSILAEIQKTTQRLEDAKGGEINNG